MVMEKIKLENKELKAKKDVKPAISHKKVIVVGISEPLEAGKEYTMKEIPAKILIEAGAAKLK